MDVSGFWTGEYAYDSIAGMRVEFKAELKQMGLEVSGNTTENNTFAENCGPILIAELIGQVSGQNMSFTKTYMNGPPGQAKISYSGSISEDGKHISGSWTMMKMWTGSFKMTRATEQSPRRQIVTANELEDA